MHQNKLVVCMIIEIQSCQRKVTEAHKTTQQVLHFTLLADLLIPTPSQFLLEAFSHSEIAAQDLSVFIIPS